MWLKLLKTKNMETLLKPSFVKGRFRAPAIKGKQRHILKQWFLRAGLPWIYEAPRPAVDETSVYNKMPKASRYEKTRKIRVAEIRKNLLDMDRRILEHRTQNINNREYTGQDRHFRDMLIAYSKGMKRMQARGSVLRVAGSSFGGAKKTASYGMKLSKKEKHLKKQSLEEDFESKNQ